MEQFKNVLEKFQCNAYKVRKAIFVCVIEMLRKRILRTFVFRLSLLLLILNVLGAFYPYFSLETGEVKANEQEPETTVPLSNVISTLPVPNGTSIMSAQAAVYWDGTYLYVWYGAQSSVGNPRTDDIYYTNAASPFTSWNNPVKVIDSAYGIRDPTVFVEGDSIYLFCQCYDGTNYRPIRLYKIAKTANFADSNNYVYIGIPVDVGSSGEFDDTWIASACVAKIDSTYWMVYEAQNSMDIYSIGRAYTNNIEGSWTKDGQLRDIENNVIYNPYGQTRDIIPDTFVDSDTLFIHIVDAAGVWRVRYVNGDFPSNSVTLSSTDCQPSDGFTHHNNFAHIGFINDRYYFIMQTWSSVGYLRLYKEMEEGESFNGGFESGEFNDWTGTSGTPTIVTDPVHHGRYAAQADAAYDYWYETFAEQTVVYVRFYFRISALISFELLDIRTSSSTIGYVNILSGGSIRYVYKNGITNEFLPGFSGYPAGIQPDTWYCIEVKHTISGTDGEVEMWFNGTSVASVTGKDTDNYGNIVQMRMGRYYGPGTCAVTCDCVVVADTYIGPEPEGDTQSPSYSNADTNTTIAGRPCLFHVLWNDDVNVSGYIFGCNITGQWINDTWTEFTAYYNGTAAWSNVTKTLPSTSDVRVEWHVWCNDTNNNWGTTGLQYFTTTENVPTIGEFQAPSIVYANRHFLLNTTINDVDGISDFANATIEISNDVTLGWIASTDTFSEQSDPYGYCTLDSAGSFKTQINSTAYKLSFKIKLGWPYPEGPTSVIPTNTKVFNDKGASGSASYANLFYFEDDLVVYSASVDDSRINPSQTITFTGTLHYQDSATPPEDTYGITAKVELNNTLKGSTTTISAEGIFSISFTGESSIAQISYVVFASTDENTIQNQTMNVIVDRIKIIEGGVTKETLILGETATVWFKAAYEYDSSIFTDVNGTLYLNGFPMSWSQTNARWEHTYLANTLGTATFTVSAVYDSSQDLTTINDMAGTQTITVRSTPFSIISNSTITELSFNSTSKTITFTVTGPDETIGYTNLTIAKTLIEDVDGLQIYVDENLIDYTVTPADYYWLIHFTYSHSTHKVLIIINQANANSTNLHPHGIITFGITIFLVVAILLACRKIRKNNN